VADALYMTGVIALFKNAPHEFTPCFGGTLFQDRPKKAADRNPSARNPSKAHIAVHEGLRVLRHQLR